MISLRSGEKRPSYIVNAPEFIHEILVAKEAYFRKGRSSEVLRRTIGDGLLTSEKEEHRRQKKYLTPAFYKERIQAYARIVAEESQRAIESLQDGQPVELHDEMMRLTLSVIAKGMFATDVAERKKELADASISRFASRHVRCSFRSSSRSVCRHGDTAYTNGRFVRWSRLFGKR